MNKIFDGNKGKVALKRQQNVMAAARKSIIKKLEEEADKYEHSKMLCSDSKVEIDILVDELWLSDYSESRKFPKLISKICIIDDVLKDKLIKEIKTVCDKHHWAYWLQ